MEGVYLAAQRPLLDIAPEVSGALFYLDAGAAEAVQLSIGLPMLLGLGASNVCALEEAHADDALLPTLTSADGQPPSALAVFTTGLLTDVHQQIMHALMVHPSVTRCMVYASVSEHAHALQAATQLGVEAYREYASVLEEDVLEARRAAAGRAAAAAPAAAPFTRPPGGSAAALPVRVQVKQLPLVLCALDGGAFVLPAHSAAAAMALAGGRAAGFGPADGGGGFDAGGGDGDELDGTGASGGLSLLAHLLVDMGAQMGARLDAFSIGPVAAGIAKEFVVLPQRVARAGAPEADALDALSGGSALGPNSMALVIIDRSLDLATPCLHVPHPYDMALSLLPRRGPPGPQPHASQPGRHRASPRVPWRPADVWVGPPSLSSLAGAQLGSSSGQGPGAASLAPGSLCLWQPSDKAAAARLEQLVGRRPKDAAPLLRKWLRDALRQEKLQPAERLKLSAGVAPGELRMLAGSLVAAPESALRQLRQPVVAWGCAAAEGLSCPAATRWEALGALERTLLMALPEGSDAASMLVPALLDALRQVAAHKGPLVADDLLQLLVALYSLSGDLLPPHPPFHSDDERRLKEALADALAAARPEEVDCLPGVQALLARGGAGAQPPRAELAAAVDRLFGRLKWLAAARGKLRDVRRLMAPPAADDPAAEVVPLVRQVLAKVLLQADNRDAAPAAAASSMVGGLLNRGLGRLAGLAGVSAGAKAHQLGDYPAVLLFVVGGLSPAEVRGVRAELDAHTFGHKPRVVVGGTALLGPADAARHALAGV